MSEELLKGTLAGRREKIERKIKSDRRKIEIKTKRGFKDIKAIISR